MDRPCDICGGYTDQGIAVKKLIVICSKCTIAREHVYCMRDNLSSWSGKNWLCESCTTTDEMLSQKYNTKEVMSPFSADIANPDGKHQASPQKSLKESGWKAHSIKQKAVTSGKVVQISLEEVQQLEKVAPQSPISKVKEPCRRGRPPKMHNVDISVKSRDCYNSGTLMPPRCGRPTKTQSFAISEKTRGFTNSKSFAPRRRGVPFKMQRISTILKNSEEKRSPGTHTERHIIDEQPREGSKLSHGAETSSREIVTTVKEPYKISYMPSPSRHSSPNTSSGGNVSASEQSDGEERDTNFTTNFSLHVDCSYRPSLQAIWKGGFNILDADRPAQFIGGFQAQTPHKVLRKVYDLSQKMPPVLQVDLLPQSHLWADLFGDECPDIEDVALYIFPDDNTTSSRVGYDWLFDKMDTTTSVMRIYVDGVDAMELLIFTSKQLRLDLPNTFTSQKTIKFLWGIFRPRSDRQAHMEDNGTTVDMEVDMVGGNMVGTIDVIVTKDLIPEPDIDDNGTTVDMEVDMVGGKMVGTVDVAVSQALTPEPVMTPVQQHLANTRGNHSSYRNRLNALDSTIKKLLGVKPEVRNDDCELASSSSVNKHTEGLRQLKLEKDEKMKP